MIQSCLKLLDDAILLSDLGLELNIDGVDPLILCIAIVECLFKAFLLGSKFSAPIRWCVVAFHVVVIVPRVRVRWGPIWWWGVPALSRIVS